MTGSGAVVAVTLRGTREGTGEIRVESAVLGSGSGTATPAPPTPGRLVVSP